MQDRETFIYYLSLDGKEPSGEETFRAALTIGDYILFAKSKNAENFMRDMEIVMEPVAQEFHLQPSTSKIYPCTDFAFRESHFIKYVVTKHNSETNEYEPIILEGKKQLWFVIEIYENLDVGFRDESRPCRGNGAFSAASLHRIARPLRLNENNEKAELKKTTKCRMIGKVQIRNENEDKQE